jgi:hypothetical protein
MSSVLLTLIFFLAREERCTTERCTTEGTEFAEEDLSLCTSVASVVKSSLVAAPLRLG